MKKISDFIKKTYPFIIVNLLGAAGTIITLINNGILPYLNFPSIFFLPTIKLGLFGFLAVNIIAYLLVAHDKKIAGLILSLFGSAGAFIGVLSNKEYKFKKAVIIIFNIRIWIAAWIVAMIFYVGSHF